MTTVIQTVVYLRLYLPPVITQTVGALVFAYCVPVVVLSHIQALTRVFHMYIFHSTGYAEQNTHTKQMVED